MEVLNVCFEGVDVNILFSSDVLESWCESLFTYVEDDVRRVMITDLITWKHVGCQNVPNIGCDVVDSFTSITCWLIDMLKKTMVGESFDVTCSDGRVFVVDVDIHITCEYDSTRPCCCYVRQ